MFSIVLTTLLQPVKLLSSVLLRTHGSYEYIYSVIPLNFSKYLLLCASEINYVRFLTMIVIYADTPLFISCRSYAIYAEFT